MKRYSRLRAALILMGALFLCAQMSAELTVRGCRRAAEAGGLGPQRPRTVLSLFVGELEELVGRVLLLKADSYFHGQTSILGDTRIHDESEAWASREDDAPGAEHRAPGQSSRERAVSYDHLLYRQYTKVASTAHVHLDRGEEIVPWLYASVRLNPGDERAAVMTAYWLGQRLGQPRKAEQVLRAALAERPSSWRLRAELGWLHYRQGRYGAALRQCSSALQLFEAGDDAEQARLDLAELWRLAGACQEALGDLERAIACAEQVVALVPQSRPARDRLERLRMELDGEGGQTPHAAGFSVQP